MPRSSVCLFVCLFVFLFVLLCFVSVLYGLILIAGRSSSIFSISVFKNYF